MLATCPARSGELRRELEGGRYADGFDGDVGTEAAGELADDGERVLAAGYHVGGADEARTQHRDEPDRAGADDGDHAAGPHLAIEDVHLACHLARRQVARR